jgi:hypothetical protein
VTGVQTCALPIYHEDIGTKTLHGLVNGVIDNFKHQVMKAVNTGRAYIHSRTLAYSFQTLKNSDVLRRIIIG